MPASGTIKILELVTRLSITAFRGTKLLRKIDYVNIDNYSVKIVRRGILGKDKGISQMVKIFKNNKLVEVWHVVVKAGRVIHKDIKIILK